MCVHKSFRGNSETPFPGEGKSRELRKEDAFMELHGGAGARLAYRIVCGIEEAVITLGSLLFRDRHASRGHQHPEDHRPAGVVADPAAAEQVPR